jgi:HD-GYP domain-containing protein (c-di-GMP phosphodiesterase class II)
VAEIAHRVGQAMELSAEELEETTRAAELHDVGKMAIPDGILHKPGALDPEEWEFMKRHTVFGERILAAAPALLPVARLVRSSHEHWDGSGYPDALAGEDIPLGSRIILVCDAYHAMITQRPYASAISHADAVKEVRRCAGGQFDPDVVEAFCSVIDEAGQAGELSGAGEASTSGRRD